MNQLFEEKIGISHLKECPICHEKCFADIEVCFGCLYRFTDEDNKKVFTDSAETMKLKGTSGNFLVGDQLKEDAKWQGEEKTAVESLGDCATKNSCQFDAAESESRQADSEVLVVENSGELVNSSEIAGFEVTVQIKPIKKG